MFGFNNRIEISDLRLKVAEVEKENAVLQRQLKNAHDDLALIASESKNATPYIDFDIMRVFSIERNNEGRAPCTMLGYYMNDPVMSSDGEMLINRDVVKEWTLFCNTDRHEELVSKFIEWKKSNGN